MQQSDRESGEQMSDEPHADMSTALVQYHQHSPDFAAMLRGFPEISEVPSPTQVQAPTSSHFAAEIAHRQSVDTQSISQLLDFSGNPGYYSHNVMVVGESILKFITSLPSPRTP